MENIVYTENWLSEPTKFAIWDPHTVSGINDWLSTFWNVSNNHDLKYVDQMWLHAPHNITSQARLFSIVNHGPFNKYQAFEVASCGKYLCPKYRYNGDVGLALVNQHSWIPCLVTLVTWWLVHLDWPEEGQYIWLKLFLNFWTIIKMIHLSYTLLK